MGRFNTRMDYYIILMRESRLGSFRASCQPVDAFKVLWYVYVCRKLLGRGQSECKCQFVGLCNFPLPQTRLTYLYGLRPQREGGWSNSWGGGLSMPYGWAFLWGFQTELKTGEKGEDARAMRLRDIVATDVQPRFLPSPHRR